MSFENSICTEYITEKFWRTLRLPVIPVVLGPSPDYKKVAPPKSYIDVNDFNSVEELAKYLKYLDQNDEEYLSYFKWRKDFDMFYSNNAYCTLCKKLNDPLEPPKVYENLRAWYLYNKNNFSQCIDGKNPQTRKYYKSMINITL